MLWRNIGDMKIWKIWPTQLEGFELEIWKWVTNMKIDKRTHSSLIQSLVQSLIHHSFYHSFITHSPLIHHSIITHPSLIHPVINHSFITHSFITHFITHQLLRFSVREDETKRIFSDKRNTKALASRKIPISYHCPLLYIIFKQCYIFLSKEWSSVFTRILIMTLNIATIYLLCWYSHRKWQRYCLEITLFW